MELKEMARLEAAGKMSADLAKVRDAYLDAAKAFTVRTEGDTWLINVDKLYMSVDAKTDEYKFEDLVGVFKTALHVALQQAGLM